MHTCTELCPALFRPGTQHDGAPPSPPMQAEYVGAVRETYQLLQGVVTAINEALEEVRQAQADLLEQ